MVYVDTSVAIAHLRAEDVAPPPRLWDEQLVSSRLLAYETLSRLNALGYAATHGDAARELLRRVSLLEVIGPIVRRSAEPFPIPVRTLDAIHLATMSFLADQHVDVQLASYDRRLAAAAQTLGFAPYPL